MGMPITIEIVGAVGTVDFDAVYDYLAWVDNTFSTFKTDSEISRINRGLPKEKWSREMKTVLRLCEQTKNETNGYFDIARPGKLDPSGLVKGWAVNNAADMLRKRGHTNFYIEAGGDIQVSGHSAKDQPWTVGIRNPFNPGEMIKIIAATTEGIATSGTYIRGQHVYNPHQPDDALTDVVSLTVIGPDIYNADRFATAAFAMGKHGIEFIEKMVGYEAYMVDNKHVATLTSGFNRYTKAS